MIIKQVLTTRSKNLGYLIRLTNIESKESDLIVAKFKGKDPSPEIITAMAKLDEYIKGHYEYETLYDVRIDNNLYLELLDKDWDQKYVVNLEKDFSNPFESPEIIQEEA